MYDTPEHGAFRAEMLAYGTPAQSEPATYLQGVIDELQEEVSALTAELLERVA